MFINCFTSERFKTGQYSVGVVDIGDTIIPGSGDGRMVHGKNLRLDISVGHVRIDIVVILLCQDVVYTDFH